MIIYTKKEHLKGIPAKWRKDFPFTGKEIIYKLEKLFAGADNKITVKEIEQKVIEFLGSDNSYTDIICSECRQSVDVVIFVGIVIRNGMQSRYHK